MTEILVGLDDRPAALGTLLGSFETAGAP